MICIQAAQWLDTEPIGWEDLVQMNCDPTHLLPLLQSDYHGNLDSNGKAFLKQGSGYNLEKSLWEY